MSTKRYTKSHFYDADNFEVDPMRFTCFNFQHNLSLLVDSKRTVKKKGNLPKRRTCHKSMAHKHATAFHLCPTQKNTIIKWAPLYCYRKTFSLTGCQKVTYKQLRSSPGAPPSWTVTPPHPQAPTPQSWSRRVASLRK